MTPKIFDSHAHYDSHQFDEDRAELLQSMQENNIGTVVNSAADWDSLTEVVDLAGQYPFVYAAIGLHPDEVKILDEEKFLFLKEQAKKEKVVAIGEIGLDLYWTKEYKELQIEMFEKQLQMALEYNMPICIHSRDAIELTYQILSKNNYKGIIHCYSGSLEMANKFIKLGYLLGIGGVVTFKNSNLYKVVEEVGIKNIVLETDSPYLAPDPYRGKQNTPLLIEETYKFIAEILNISVEELAGLVIKNTKKLFSVG